MLVAQSCPTLCDPMDCSPPGSSVHGFSRQGYWSGLSFPSPGDLPDPGMEPSSPALAGGFLGKSPHQWKGPQTSRHIFMNWCINPERRTSRLSNQKENIQGESCLFIYKFNKHKSWRCKAAWLRTGASGVKRAIF